MDLLKLIKQSELGKTHIFFVGQAGFIIKSSNGQLLGIDLYLSDCVERIEPNHMGFKRLLPKILSPSDLVFDALICTHFHRDHYDVDSVPILMNNNKTRLYCAEDCIDDAKDFERVSFVKPGMTIKSGDFKLHFINCDHGTGAPLAVGVIVEVDNKLILEVGDTCLRTDRKNEYLSQGNIDVMIAPINGAYGNLDSNECAKLSSILNPKITIPCHYGMFAAHHGDVGLFQEIMDNNYPENRYLIMSQGEKYSFEVE